MSRIIYNRQLKKSDFTDFDGELIFFKDNNIAFIVVEKDSNFIIRKKKIFNNQQVSEKTVKTVSQVLKIVK